MCNRLQGCGLLDPTSVNCGEVGTYDLFGCNDGDTGSRIANGLDTFDDVAGQACLNALAGNGCDAASLSAVSIACSKLRKANVPVGGDCIDDSDCIFPDAGPFAFASDPNATPTCQISYNDVTCGGTCVFGVNPGDLCNLYAAGMGCVSGDCEIVTPDDGGFGSWTCVGYVEADGGDCTVGTADCDPSLYYCAPSTSTCTPYAADGGDCNLADATNALSTPCGPNAFCLSANDAGTGLCAPINQPGDACDPTQSSPCGRNSTCLTTAFGDGGDFSICTGNQPQLGGHCSPYYGVGCGDQATCSDEFNGVCEYPHVVGELCDPSWNEPACIANLSCATGADGGNVCQALAVEGQPCGSNGCAPLLECATVDDGGSVCVSQKVIGQSCDVNDYTTCGDGYCAQLPDAGTACQPLVPLGQPCDPNQNQSPCGSNGDCSTFWNGTDGGAVCIGWCQRET